MPVEFESVNRSVTRESAIGNGEPCSVDGDIVITGISGRLPKSSNIEEFKENLLKGVDMVTDDKRWSTNSYGIPGKSARINNIDRFDTSFFGVHPKQAHVMDPQLRILLEVVYEAIVDAGVNPSTIRGSRTGVFMGVTYTETEDLLIKNADIATGSYYEKTMPIVFSINYFKVCLLITIGQDGADVAFYN
ncbi:PREDICTED: fatty acid synthase-like [Vollenhovia emeryi]|uniref:fatty acid synthase-like n=1 Tax=Vollenhovia emeryi TaxID=411798 RepID=UPI0005F400E8|nr:PREDICTED: fatty acid synthase-like [Vollenhovia emeryi]XP_011875369.1 PREDICTED: fatty acid synthase-like [Vollenhovia emeryi]